MQMRNGLKEMFQNLLKIRPVCYAAVEGSTEHPGLRGNVWFYSLWGGMLVLTEVFGLPVSEAEDGMCEEKVFGFHIHEGNTCTGNSEDPFADTGGHFNPVQCLHPQHAGDFPPLFGNDGYALMMFFTSRFEPEEVEGRTVVIHGMQDDFHSQPSGNAGEKIACGIIKAE